MTADQKDWSRFPWWALLFLLSGWSFILAPVCIGGNLPGNSGDSRFNLYILEHFYQSLSSSGKSFLDAPFFYPWPATIGFSDTHWGTGLIYAFFRVSGKDSFEAFSLWFVLGNLLNFCCSYYVFRKFGLRQLGGSFGAFLFCFSLPVTSQFSHVQLVYRAGIPLALLFLQRYLVSRNPLLGAVAFLFLCLQIAATFYLGIFLILLMGGWILGWIILSHQQVVPTWGGSLRGLFPSLICRRRNIMALLVLICGGIVAGMAIWPNLEASKLYGFKRSWDEIKIGLPVLASYLQASHSYIWWPNHNSWPKIPLWWEQNLFPGLFVVIGVSLSFRRFEWASNPMVFLSKTSLIFMLVATISLHGQSFYYFLGKAPGFDAIRAICREILAMIFPAALITGAFVDGLVRQTRFRSSGCIAAMVLILFSLYEASNISHQRDKTAIWIDRLDSLEKEIRAVHDGAFKESHLLVYTFPEKAKPEWWEFLYEIDAMLISQKLGISTLNGYSGNLPHGWKRMSTTEDVLDNIASAQKFRISHGLPEVKIAPDDLILVGKGTMDTGRISHELSFPVLADGKEVRVDSDPEAFKRYYLNDGWTDIEQGRVMSRGSRASLIIGVTSSEMKNLTLDLEVPRDLLAENRLLRMTVNGMPAGEAVFTRDSYRKKVSVHLPKLISGHCVVTISMPSPDLVSQWKNGGLSTKRKFMLWGLGMTDGDHAEASDRLRSSTQDIITHHEQS